MGMEKNAKGHRFRVQRDMIGYFDAARQQGELAPEAHLWCRSAQQERWALPGRQAPAPAPRAPSTESPTQSPAYTAPCPALLQPRWKRRR